MENMGVIWFGDFRSLIKTFWVEFGIVLRSVNPHTTGHFLQNLTELRPDSSGRIKRCHNNLGFSPIFCIIFGLKPRFQAAFLNHRLKPVAIQLPRSKMSSGVINDNTRDKV